MPCQGGTEMHMCDRCILAQIFLMSHTARCARGFVFETLHECARTLADFFLLWNLPSHMVCLRLLFSPSGWMLGGRAMYAIAR